MRYLLESEASQVIARRQRFVRYAWFVLVLNIGVILWGAVVRATGAGAGCGEHWPLCNGQVIPPAPEIKTLIEYGHRVTSALALLCVIGLVFLARRTFPRGHAVRRAAVFSLIFELTEGLIGAGLVLLGHVGTNSSMQRGYSLGLHLSNTLLLLAALALTAWCAHPEREGAMPISFTQGGRFRFLVAAAAVGILLIGVTGAIAALGDTLFAAGSLAEGMSQDFASGAHPFIRLRILHPIIACILGVYMLVLSGYALSAADTNAEAKRLGLGLIGVIVLQLCLGAVNLLLLAPVPLQVAHLLLADILWITFVLFSAELLTPGKRVEVGCFTLPN